MKGDRLGLALLGCGDAARMHAGTLRKVGGALDLFFASRDAERARDFARSEGGSGAFGSYEEAVADERVDVVMVTTPPASHLEWTLAALAEGNDVIVEKPPFPRLDDFDRAVEAAESAGRRLMVAENYFYKPLLSELRRLLTEGVVGRPLFVNVNALKTQETEGWRDDPALVGGGALLEGGIHWVDLMANLGLEVVGVTAFRPRPAEGAPGGGEAGPERSVLLVFEYAGGAVGTLSYSWDVASLPGGPRVSRIHGTEGSILFESNGIFLATAGRRWRFGFPGLRDLRGFRAMFRDFLGAIREERRPAYTLAAARRDLELVEEAYRSLDRTPDPTKRESTGAGGSSEARPPRN